MDHRIVNLFSDLRRDLLAMSYNGVCILVLIWNEITTKTILLFAHFLNPRKKTIAYVQDVGDGELRISVDLDEGCFCNDGGGDDEANTGCDKDASRDVEGGCRENYFAMSGIQAGEELLCSYSQFVVGDGWKGFGL